MSNHYGITRTNLALALTHGAGVTTSAAQTIVLNGYLAEVLFTTPASVDSAATVTVKLTDQDGYNIYASAATAAGSTKVLDILDTANTTYKGPIPLSGTYTVQTTYSANQTATDSITNVVLLTQQAG